jgi:hypothetical protein
MLDSNFDKKITIETLIKNLEKKIQKFNKTLKIATLSRRQYLSDGSTNHKG